MFQNDDVKKGFNDGDFDDFIWPRPTSPPLISTGMKSSLHAASFLWWWEIPMIWVLRTTKDDDREEDKRNVDRWREGMLQGSCVRCFGSWSTLELLSFSQKHTGLLFFWPNPQHYIGKVTETQNPTFKKTKGNRKIFSAERLLDRLQVRSTLSLARYKTDFSVYQQH